jgi:ATP-dependent Clp protease ATP-binding subunit ClpC
VFERYTEESRRAIFFAKQTALKENRPAIDSGHLLLGLLNERNTRADTVFHLRNLLPDEAAQQALLTKQRNETIPLTDDGKRSLAYTAHEADDLRDYWIETEHLVLGILRESENTGAGKLRSVGLNIDAARKLVAENKSTRSTRRVPLLRQLLFPRPLGVALQIAFLLGIIVGMVLLGTR